MSYILRGGMAIESDPESPRAFYSRQVASWAKHVTNVSIAELRAKYDREAFVNADLYPQDAWKAAPKGEFERCLYYFKILKAFLRKLRREQSGVVISL